MCRSFPDEIPPRSASRMPPTESVSGFALGGALEPVRQDRQREVRPGRDRHQRQQPADAAVPAANRQRCRGAHDAEPPDERNEGEQDQRRRQDPGSLEAKAEGESDHEQEARGAHRDVEQVVGHRAELDRQRLRRREEQRLQRAGELFLANLSRDAHDRDPEEDADGDPDRDELHVRRAAAAVGRQVCRIDHAADQIEEAGLERERDPVREEGNAIAPGRDRVAAQEREQLRQLAFQLPDLGRPDEAGHRFLSPTSARNASSTDGRASVQLRI